MAAPAQQAVSEMTVKMRRRDIARERAGNVPVRLGEWPAQAYPSLNFRCVGDAECFSCAEPPNYGNYRAR